MKKKIILIILAAAAAVFAGLAIHDYVKEQTAGQYYEEVQEEFKKTVTATPTPGPTVEAAEVTAVPTETPTPTPTPEPVEIPIDFEALTAVNPDIYAWITIPDTQVDYPILQNPDDDEYYLHRDIYGNEEYAGSLFTQATYNTKDFETDPVTIVYGHSMKNGTMLRSIKNYMDREFFETHPDLVIYTPDAILHYHVFAAYIYDDRHIGAYYNQFETPGSINLYIDDIYSVRDMSAIFDDEIKDELNADSRILTLSTCYDADSQQRYLLQAVLTDVEH